MSLDLSGWQLVLLVFIVCLTSIIHKVLDEEAPADFTEVGGGTVESRSEDNDCRLGFRRK